MTDYAEMIELVPLPLFTIVDACVIRSANRAAAELLAQERSELIFRRLDELVQESDREHLARYLSNGSTSRRGSCEVRLLLPHRATLSVQIRAQASSREPSIQYVSLLDLRDRDFDAWEKQQIKLIAQRAASDSRQRGRLLVALHDRLSSLMALGTMLHVAPSFTEELGDTLDSLRDEGILEAAAGAPDSTLDARETSRPSQIVRCGPLPLSRLDGKARR